MLAALEGALARASAKRRAELLGVRGDLLIRAEEATALLVEGAAPVLPAWQRYTGVVWTHLDPGTLGDVDRLRVLVPSALYGLTTGTDPVADYRLKMSVSLPGLGKLSSFWRADLTELLGRRCRGGIVVNLLPAEHDAAFDWAALQERCEVVAVRFLSSDGKAAVGHAAKAVKGVLARALLTGGVAAATRVRHDGWRVRSRAGVLEVLAP